MQLQPPKPSAAGWAEEQHISPCCMARRSSSSSSSVLCILLKKPSSSSLTERLGVKCRPLHYVLYQNWANWWRKGRPQWRQGSCGLSNCLIRTHQIFSAGALWHKAESPMWSSGTIPSMSSKLSSAITSSTSLEDAFCQSCPENLKCCSTWEQVRRRKAQCWIKATFGTR